MDRVSSFLKVAEARLPLSPLPLLAYLSFSCNTRQSPVGALYFAFIFTAPATACAFVSNAGGRSGSRRDPESDAGACYASGNAREPCGSDGQRSRAAASAAEAARAGHCCDERRSRPLCLCVDFCCTLVRTLHPLVESRLDSD